MSEANTQPPTIEQEIAELQQLERKDAIAIAGLGAGEQAGTSPVNALEAKLDAHLAEWESYKKMLSAAGFRLG